MAATCVAQVLADVVGAVFGGRLLRSAVLAELRDSVPIVSTGAPSCLLLSAAAFGWLSPAWAQAAASASVILRIAAVGLVYRRLREPISLRRALWFGGLTAVAVGLAAGLKLTSLTELDKRCRC